jgi:capping protein alpha
MAEYEEEIPDEDKVKIASDFIVHAPPGEFNEVFNDVRVLLGNDQLLKEGASGAFGDYNEQQFTPATVEGSDDQCLITENGRLGDNKYLDPRTGQSFSFDHLRKSTTDVEAADVDDCDGFRSAFEEAVTQYTKDHYMKGACSVYGAGDEVTSCIEHHKFQPNNFWNGRWRSQWTFNKSTGAITGVLKVQVHYYEDGNVQMTSNKTINDKVTVSDPAATAKQFVKKVEAAESVYQKAISSNYTVMSDTTFKALRRALPITRQKLDWNKVLNYKIGKEIANK